MRELHVVALSEDGRSVLLAQGKRAAEPAFRVRVEGRLTAAVRGELPRAGENGVRPLEVTPKEIQARLRAGESAEQIAAAAGVPVGRIERFAGPVLSERERVLQQAQAATLTRGRLGPSQLPLGDAVQAALAETSSLKPESVRWATRRLESGHWLVQLSYVARSRTKTASWVLDPATRSVTASDPASAALGHRSDAPVQGRAAALAEAARAAAAAGGTGAARAGGATGTRSTRTTAKARDDRPTAASGRAAPRRRSKAAADGGGAAAARRGGKPAAGRVGTGRVSSGRGGTTGSGRGGTPAAARRATAPARPAAAAPARPAAAAPARPAATALTAGGAASTGAGARRPARAAADPAGSGPAGPKAARADARNRQQARPVGAPALRVVPPPAPDPVASARPEAPPRRRAAGERASVPAWADVLLGIAPRDRDDD